jgi:orotate phosphoribosyltransferase
MLPCYTNKFRPLAAGSGPRLRRRGTAGLIIQDVVVLVERSQGGRESLLAEGINLHAILNLDEILSVLINNGLIESEMYTQVTHYLEGSN